jgi:hypothetical protein
MEPRRFFTPSEANAVLPEVARLMEAARDRLLHWQRLVLMLGDEGLPEPQRLGVVQEAEQARTELAGLLARVQSMGCEVKAIDGARVDFPALRGGREVFLVWKQGEAGVGCWYPVDAGYLGRKPIAGEDPRVFEWCS